MDTTEEICEDRGLKSSEAHPGQAVRSFLDLEQSPFIVIWEITQACDLACVHCRACAQPNRHPDELSTEEGFRLIEEIRRFNPDPVFSSQGPLFVITGGDPMKRPDVFDLVGHARAVGLRVAMSPSGTPLVTRDAVFRLRRLGLARLAISIDGPDAAVHDAFRRVSGSFEWSMNVVRYCQEAGLPLQVNTTVTRQNIQHLERMKQLLLSIGGLELWSVFFLVPTGRGKAEDNISAEECENVLQWLYRCSLEVPFDIKTTAAPHYRRVVLQNRAESGGAKRVIGVPKGTGIQRAPRGINDGQGFLFISHTGEVFPSGFLPVSAGNVRTHSVVELYRNHPLFKELRNPDLLKGKCGVCEYRRVCGGSRARAYAATGDYLAEEPLCAYRPARLNRVGA